MKRIPYALVLLLAACGAGSDVAQQSSAITPPQPVFRDYFSYKGKRITPPTEDLNPRVVYLNREGRTYVKGDAEDSINGVSTLLTEQKLDTATIKKLSWAESKWKTFRDCVTDEFKPFHVKVVDQRPDPADGTYVEASIGGTGSEIKMPFGVLGVAMVDDEECKPIPGSIVFVFAESWLAGSTQTVCETATHEIGHALGPLDHSMLSSDPMTYLSFNGHKVFRDQDFECGEQGNRECLCKQPKQNSVKLLLEVVGKAGCDLDGSCP